MSGLRQMFLSLSRSEAVPAPSTPEFKALQDRAGKLLEFYSTSTSINPDFCRDVFQLIVGTLDLAETMKEPYYSLDEYLHLSTTMSKLLSGLTIYARQARSKAAGWVIVTPSNGRIIPGFFASQGEALAQIEEYKLLAPGVSYIAQEAELSCATVKQPGVQLPAFSIPQGSMPPPALPPKPEKEQPNVSSSTSATFSPPNGGDRIR